MSDIIKAQNTGITEAKPKRGRKAKTQEVQVQQVAEVQAPVTSLADAAIAAADLELVTAANAFNARWRENVGRLTNHIQSVTEQTGEALLQNLYGQAGITEDEVYGTED